MSNLRIGIIGCGKQGEKHAKSLHSIGNVDLVCADIDEVTARSLSAALGVTNEATDKVLGDKNVSAVIICTPTNSHLELIDRALKSGKHVFCEKPLCLTIEEAHYIKNLERETGFFVTVGFVYRYVPVFERLFELASPGNVNTSSLGKPLHAIFRIGGRGEHQIWKHMQSQGGGVLNEMLIHMLDLAIWVLGPLHNVSVKESRLLLRNRTIQGQTVTVDAQDYIMASATTALGAPVIFIGDMVTPAFIQYVDAQFENGSYSGSIQPTYPSRVYLKEARGGLEAGETQIEIKEANFFMKQMESFISNISENKKPDYNTVEDSIAVMVIANDMQLRIKMN